MKCLFVCMTTVNVSVCWLARQFNSSDKSTSICSNGICYLNEHLFCLDLALIFFFKNYKKKGIISLKRTLTLCGIVSAR